jgi:GH24 family phage-related lysozyme (muramidase)
MPKAILQLPIVAVFSIAVALPVAGQNLPAVGGGPAVDGGRIAPLSSAASSDAVSVAHSVPAALSPAVRQLLDFKDSDVKFELHSLMSTLRDSRHEGWVLAAYPDPKTRHPLIGAGFTLDLPAREHLQHDPLNPHPFLEPSSAELWQAAGLDSDRLQKIIAQFNEGAENWTKRNRRARIRSLDAQITSEDATQLLRVAAIQAIYNAKAYCRNFDQMSASQQMALSQLVYQLGVNLDQFSSFLNLINNGFTESAAAHGSDGGDAGYWRNVQHSLMESQWARLYRARAVAVIAMLDAQYADSPNVAEGRIGGTLRPASVTRRGRGRSAGSLRTVSYHERKGKATHKAASHRRRQ